MKAKKITLATVKSFVKKNSENLYINLKRDFDAMIDGSRQLNGGFEPAQKTEKNLANTLGLVKAWVVGDSRDYFQHFENEEFTGIQVSNCCSTFILAVKK